MEELSSIIVNPYPKANPYATDWDWLDNMLTISSLIWLVGLISLGLYFLFLTLGFRIRVGESRKLDNKEVLFILEACKEKLDITKTIPIYETNTLHSPCIYGLTKPRVYLPEDIVTIAPHASLRTT
ncbi:beta-lactamase regulating signal transducer with metallopeptidase domain [Paenibacillus sp. DS2015]|uniref:M56 family metallopeptidase n=1 Tax=Paenibacillus sp. DS2015 TaxID=3373917 RepID=UPI003D1A28FC